ncbi:MAG: efflux RND transporter periplasmic adaptor subunit [Pseudomonadota bacterium]
MKKLRLIILIIVLAALGVLAAFYFAPGSPRQALSLEKSEVRKIKIKTVRVEPTLIRDVLILPGETKAWKDVKLAANEGGRVEWVGVREGDRIKEGQLLVKVDVSALKAILDNALAAFKLADQNYQRRLRLFEQKIISREDLDQSRTDREVKLGMVRQAEVNYNNGFVKSPIDGIVNHLYVDPGEYVAKGGAVADIVNVSQIEIDVNVPELDVRYLQAGQNAAVTIDAFGDRMHNAKVDFVSFKADPATKTFQTKLLMDNNDLRVRPGMIARVIFLRRVIPDALVAPLFVLVDKGGERFLFVEEGGLAHARKVSLGVIDGDRVQITSGLEAGDNLIVTGQTEVDEGTPVLVE